MKNLLTFGLLFSLVIFSQAQKLKLPKGWQYIPMGQFENKNAEKISLQAFYIYETEISNLEYKEFISYLESTGNNQLLEICKVKEQNWNFGEMTNQPYATYYYSHPAYKNYPVVNISYEAAVEYCNFVEKRINKNLKGYKVKVRLPLEIEWEYAASGGNIENIYPWEGTNLKNSKGEIYANYKAFKEVSINVDGDIKSEDVVAPSMSYSPNKFKLYNMSGNVAEFVEEKGVSKGGSWNSSADFLKIRNQENYTEPNPFTGFRPLLSFTKL